MCEQDHKHDNDLPRCGFRSQQASTLGAGHKACLEHDGGPSRGELKVVARQAFRLGDKHKAFCEDEIGLKAAGELTIAAEKDVEHQEKHEPSQVEDPDRASDPWTVVIISRNTPSAIHSHITARGHLP